MPPKDMQVRLTTYGEELNCQTLGPNISSLMNETAVDKSVAFV